MLARPSPTVGNRPSTAVALTVFAHVTLLLSGCATTGDSGPSEQTLVGEPERPDGRPGGVDGASESNRREGALWYRIVVRGDELGIALRLFDPPPHTSFFVPSVDPDASIVSRSLTFEGARGPDGPAAYDRLPSDGRIDVETRDMNWVQLEYRIALDAFPDDAGRPLPDVADHTILGYFPALLVVPSKGVVNPIRDIPVEIHAPRDWKVRATWSNQSRKRTADGESRVHGYVASDVRTLRDAFFVAGRDLGLRRSDGGDILAAFPADTDLPRGRFLSLTTEITDAYRRRFGDPGRVLVFARPSGDASTPKVRGTAKRNGFVVHLPDQKPLRPDVRMLVAHEAFHLWNGHRAIPEPATSRETRWFEEGLTHYVAIKTAWETGLVDRRAVRRQFAKSAFYYRRNPASSGGRATALDRNRLPYDRGVFLALALDDTLRDCSNGKRGIAHWFRRLLDTEPTYYDLQKLKSTYLASAGRCSSAAAQWRQYVPNPAALEPSDILADVGLHYLEASTVGETRVLPIEGEGTLFRSLFDKSRDTADTSTRESNRDTSDTDATP